MDAHVSAPLMYSMVFCMQMLVNASLRQSAFSTIVIPQCYLPTNFPTGRSLPAKDENARCVKRPMQFQQCCMRNQTDILHNPYCILIY